MLLDSQIRLLIGKVVRVVIATTNPNWASEMRGRLSTPCSQVRGDQGGVGARCKCQANQVFTKARRAKLTDRAIRTLQKMNTNRHEQLAAVRAERNAADQSSASVSRKETTLTQTCPSVTCLLVRHMTEDMRTRFPVWPCVDGGSTLVGLGSKEALF